MTDATRLHVKGGDINQILLHRKIGNEMTGRSRSPELNKKKGLLGKSGFGAILSAGQRYGASPAEHALRRITSQ
jgi:hypothetical protein